MKLVSELWGPLAAAAPSARVVVRTADGDEVDVRSVTGYANLCVIETDAQIRTRDAGLEDAAGDVITPEQLSDLLDAHPAGVEECAAMLAELHYRGVLTAAALTELLHIALDETDCDDPANP